MLPRNLVLLVVVGLCATQMASAHREARGIAEMFAAAQGKLAGLVIHAQDAARSSIKTVQKYINGLENDALDSGTEFLLSHGVQINLHDVAGLLKENVKICAQDETVKTEAREIIGNVATCITKEVGNLKNLVTDMRDLWETTKSLPTAMGDVFDTCRQADAEVADEPIPIDVDVIVADDTELAALNNDIIESASHHVSERALWNMKRISNCVTSVFNLAKGDIATLPGEILTTATHAFQVVRGVQGGIPACVARKVAESSAAISKLGLQLGYCVAAGVSEGEDLEKVLQSSPSLAVLRDLGGVADKLEEIKDSEALAAAGKVAKLIG